MDGQGFSFINVPTNIVATKGDADFMDFTNAERVGVTVVACLSACDAFIPPFIVFRGVCFSRVYPLTYLLTYLHTAWSRILFEKLTGSQLVKKSPAFHGIRRFVTTFTRARHLSLS